MLPYHLENKHIIIIITIIIIIFGGANIIEADTPGCLIGWAETRYDCIESESGGSGGSSNPEIRYDCNKSESGGSGGSFNIQEYLLLLS